MKNGNNTLTWRVTQLEKNYCELDSKVELILTNHLPHINEKITLLDGKIDVLTARVKYSLLANAIQIVALILGVVLLLKK